MPVVLCRSTCSEDIPLLAALQLLTDAANAVLHMHTRNVVHRDIKPDNMLLVANSAHDTALGVAAAGAGIGSTPVLELADFGMAELLQEPFASDRGECGTLGYMAPELFQLSSCCGKPADIYALGVAFWQVFSKATPPGQDWSVEQTRAALEAGEELPPLPAVESCPTPLQSLLRNMTAASASMRPPIQGVCCVLSVFLEQEKQRVALQKREAEENAVQYLLLLQEANQMPLEGLLLQQQAEHALAQQVLIGVEAALDFSPLLTAW